MKLLLLSLLIAASFASCKKDLNKLPEPSSSGKHFLACKVNGSVRKYSGTVDWMNASGVDYSRFVDHIEIGAGEVDYNDGISITIALPPDSVKAGITYELGEDGSKSFGEYYFRESGGPPPPHFFTTAGSGWVRFSRVDTLVGSGTFAFTGYMDGPKGRDSFVVTEGRFDLASK